MRGWYAAAATVDAVLVAAAPAAFTRPVEEGG